MSEEELQNEEENKDEKNENQNEDGEENAENKNELNQEEENNEEAKEEQNEQEPVQEQPEQKEENEIENGNNEEVKEIENNMNENENNEQIENIEPIEENKENDVIDNNNVDEEELNIVANNNENKNKINQENEHQIDDELINKEMSIKSSKNNSNGNINIENGLSFGRHGLLEGNNNFYNNLNLNTKKNTHQLLNEINNDMDLLSKDLMPLFNNHKIKQEFNYNSKIEKYDYNEFDQENKEIKDLIKKANKLVNEHNYNYYGYEYNNQSNKNYIKNNLSEIYPPNKYELENCGNYSIYMERKENSSSEEEDEDNDTGYMRNISPEKNINKYRIKNIRNIYEYNNSKNYNNKPMIYRQKETFPIKNSYMNEVIGQPQTFQKMEYSNNLVFSSDKISFRKIKYGGGNINQSLDVLFNGQK